MSRKVDYMRGKPKKCSQKWATCHKLISKPPFFLKMKETIPQKDVILFYLDEQNIKNVNSLVNSLKIQLLLFAKFIYYILKKVNASYPQK
jgi:hypothetical protein